MTPDDRARRAVRDMWSVETTVSPAEVISRAIRAAEKDALERAAKNAESSSCEEFDDAWIIARSIRSMKDEI